FMVWTILFMLKQPNKYIISNPYIQHCFAGIGSDINVIIVISHDLKIQMIRSNKTKHCHSEEVRREILYNVLCLMYKISPCGRNDNGVGFTYNLLMQMTIFY
ncbi:MAG: hypothetical protein JWQ57_1129, partial [Mucilaginibacter sp.]|nr:hypothetical protein [Mucilaginibacter sp.]